jgi:TonB family protein
VVGIGVSVGLVIMRVVLAGVGLAALGGGFDSAQSVPAGDPRDAVLQAAESLVGKALFLRGFYLADELSYDAGGRVVSSPKVGDWTVTAVNVLKVERRGPEQIELDGVRVAIRYNAEQHQFERHPLNDQKMRILVADGGSVLAMEAAFGAMFAMGIDPGLQRAMPDYWRHYFDPALAWPPDGLSGQTVYPLFGQPDQPKDVTPPMAAHRVDAKFTSFAEHDKVQGPLLLRCVVDDEGVPHRIAVARPLGYGLDEQAVRALEKWRFVPAMRDGKAVASAVVVQLDFAIVPAPRF